ncbi:MAG TPA: phage holin family protein [Candidatus Saccharimonadales bacterium]|jgi:putative membrane protein|nr:phage holin family protein [Candidatus Saccharimonadales bacterium]
MKRQFVLFVLRWFLNGFALWIATRVLGNLGAEFTGSEVFLDFLLAGLVLSVVNVLLKPILIILSLPAILLTLGLFTLIINGLMVYIVSKVVPGLDMTFTAAILAGIIVSLVNYVLTGLVQLHRPEGQKTI